MNSILVNNDNLMVFQPKLARIIGINEAIILNQIHYWLEKKKNIIEGRSWVYNTYEDWQKQICFLSVSTIKKSIKKLEGIGIVISGNFNRSKIDKTKWYTIDYEKLQQLYEKAEDKDSEEAIHIVDNTVVEKVIQNSGKESNNIEDWHINNESIDTTANGISKNNIMMDKNPIRIEENNITSGLNMSMEKINLNQAIPETNSEITTIGNEKEDNGVHEGSGDIVCEDLRDEQPVKQVVDYSEGLEIFRKERDLKGRKGNNPNKSLEMLKRNDKEEDLKISKGDKLFTSDFKKVINFYSENLTFPSSYELEKIKSLCDDMKDSGLIILAIKQSIESNARNLRYVEKVLYNWRHKGIKTVEEAEKLILGYKKYKGDRENGRRERNNWENRSSNSKDAPKDKGKWSGYKAPEPKCTGNFDYEGLI